MINLLPPKEKQELAYAKKTRILINIVVLITFCFISLWLIFKTAEIYVVGQSEIQKSFLTAQENKSEQLNKIKEKTAQINETFAKINKIYNSQIVVSNILIDLSKLLGADSSLKSFYFDKNKNIVTISGKIRNLRSLNKLREDFHNSRNFSNADFTIGTYAPYQPIEFSITFSPK